MERKQINITSIESAFGYIESFVNLEKTSHWLPGQYDLGRMRTLIEALGFPYKSYTSVHVAGTKGKGSTAAFIASALAAHGHKTGLYTSPHIVSYMERFSVCGKPVEESILIGSVGIIRDVVSDLIDRGIIASPTVFELLTLCAFICFKEAGCTHTVFEVGLGGRLDATNVIEPAACAITPIDLEHTEILGNTIEEIAFEKGGIIKEGVPVFIGFQEKAARQVFEKLSESRHAPAVFLEDELEELKPELSFAGTRADVSLSGRHKLDLSLSMIGDFQAENATLAFLLISRTFPEVSEESILKGFAAARLPGRMEIVQGSPVIVFDGAHTPLASRKLVESFKRLFPDKGVLLFGAVLGKNYAEMGKILAPHFSAIVVSTPESPRQSDPDSVFSLFSKLNSATFLEKNPEQALAKAIELSGKKLQILVTGSFYMVAAIKRLLNI
jgi:dihydrofolate synthase/folylpolyglutamate synthase